jgi:hypothetical protein
LKYDERGLGDFEKGFEFSGLIARDLSGKNCLGRIPRHETRIKTWADHLIPWGNLVRIERDFYWQISRDDIQ